MIDKRSAINSLITKDVQFTIKADEISYWSDPAVAQPTEAEIDAEVIRLQAIEDTQLYARHRQAEYPSTGDQLDMQYWDQDNDTTTWKDAIAAVKTKWPKDNSGPIE